MAELHCRSIVAVFCTAATLFATGCAQVSGTMTQSDATAVDWPNPTISQQPAPQPPEPTLLPQAVMPVAPAAATPPRAPGAKTASRSVTVKQPESPTDVWQRIRSGFQMAPLDSPLVSDWESYYASRPEYFARMIDNSRHFLFHITAEVERRGMPLEIALLPMIESAYNPVAYSHAHASGIWQFIPSTGKNYGLRQNGWYDGRRDVVAATNAALDYLQTLYGMFKDWELALASYNWGEGAVQRAVDRNQARGLPANYLSLASMPAETRNYLPKLIAVKNIIAEPARFGLSLAHVPNEPYFETITVKRHIDVTLAAQFAEMSLEEFRFLNPAHNKPVINANSAETIVLPRHKLQTFITNLESHQDKPLASLKTHVVKAGERPDKIAQQYGISVRELNSLNSIGGRRQVATGMTLLVPAKGEMEPVLADISHPVPLQAAVRSAGGKQRYAAARQTGVKRTAQAPVKRATAPAKNVKPAARKVSVAQSNRR